MKISKTRKVHSFLVVTIGLLFLIAFVSTGCTNKETTPEPKAVTTPEPAPKPAPKPEPVKKKETATPPAPDIKEFIDKVLQSNYGKDVDVKYENNTLRIQVVNFAPYYTYLTSNQKKQLTALSEDLFSALQKSRYKPANVTGHANPTGVRNEASKLMWISQARAAAMATFLADSGINVGKVEGAGGQYVIGNRRTRYGKTLNRRVVVEIVIQK